MTTYYLDTNALVKRYVDETGSPWLRALLDAAPCPSVVLVRLVVVELTSALIRRVREGVVSATEYAQAQRPFCPTAWASTSLSQRWTTS